MLVDRSWVLLQTTENFMDSDVPPYSNGLHSIHNLGVLPSGYVKIAIENGHRNSDFSERTW